ncbi:MAG TPA: radical SAM protein [Phycisphaerae bacterium]|nr:radical SAM protein [Phycisphaerae bacterium]
MSSTLQIIHRAGIDKLAEVIQHANSPTCPKGMLEINPAFGCEFRCAYCGIYALEKEYFGEVIVYDDYPDYLDEWLTKNHAAIDDYYFYFSAKTDCFQPALIESGITLRILRILKKHGARYFLVTKGGLPPQDIRDALVDARDLNQVIISATMPSEDWRQLLEPDAAPLDDRLALARFCIEQGIFVTASCCPVLPIGDLAYLKDILRRCVAAGVMHFYFDCARLSREAVLNLSDLLPEHRDEFERRYFTNEAQVTRWPMPHRNLTIDKFQPSLPYMLSAFQTLADYVREAAPEATVSVCNHFVTAKWLPGFNAGARAKCISCIGHRFATIGHSSCPT